MSSEAAEAEAPPAEPDGGALAPLDRREVADVEGWHEGVSFAEYLRINAASSSRLTRILPPNTPAHLRAYLDQPFPATTAMNLGTAIHCAVLEPDCFEERYLEEPPLSDLEGDYKNPRATKEFKEKVAALEEDNPGALVLSPEHYGMCLRFRDNMKAHPVFGPLIARGGAVEATGLFVDPDTGQPVKTRVDFAPEGVPIIVDVKSTTSAQERDFQRSVRKYGYHRQGALYSKATRVLAEKGQELAGCGNRPRVIIAALEKHPPYLVRDIEITPYLELGEREADYGLALYRECTELGEWPGYPPGATLEPDDWEEEKADFYT